MTLEPIEISKQLIRLVQSNKWDLFSKKIKELLIFDDHFFNEAISSAKCVYSGDSIVHYTVYANKIDILRLFKEHDVDLRIHNYYNQSPLEAVKAKYIAGDIEEEKLPLSCIEFLLNNVYTPVEKLFFGPNDKTTLICTFSQFYEAINEPLACYNNMTWSGLCVEEGRLEELVWLFEHGADFQVTDDFGNQLLHLINVPAEVQNFEEYSDEDYDEQTDSSSSNDWDAIIATKLCVSPPEPLKELKPVRLLSPSQKESQHRLKNLFFELHNISDASQFEQSFSKAERSSIEILIFLLSLNLFDINAKNNVGATSCHVIAEKSACNSNFAYKLIQFLERCNANLNLCDDEGANVAMVFAAHSGDGPWVTWCIIGRDCHGGGCNPNHLDVRGKSLEDYVVISESNAFDVTQ